MQWLEPWWPTDGFDTPVHETFLNELAAELGEGHPLKGVEVKMIARGDDDHVLFALRDGSDRFAVVQLTWSGNTETAPHPETVFYDSLITFAAERMIPEHQEGDW